MFAERPQLRLRILLVTPVSRQVQAKSAMETAAFPCSKAQTPDSAEVHSVLDGRSYGMTVLRHESSVAANMEVHQE